MDAGPSLSPAAVGSAAGSTCPVSAGPLRAGAAERAEQMDDFVINQGNTAWVLLSAALVLMMTPALALFYGGMVRSKSVLNMMLMSFSALGVVGVVYLLWGYSMSYGRTSAASSATRSRSSGSTGSPTATRPTSWRPTAYPAYAFVAFQATFAIITVALLSGAVADRIRFSAWLVLHRGVEHRWSTSRWPTWSGAAGCCPGRGRSARWRRRWTSPAGRWSRSGPASAGLVLAVAARCPQGLRQGPDATRTTCRSSCSVPGCCGSAGSASTPARPERPTTRRPSRGSTPWLPACTGLLGWLGDGAGP